MAGFTSESVAAFRRNGWPTCVGISGRIGSEYARWGKKLSRPVQQRITKDWKRARKRARHVPESMSRLLDALTSGHVWSVEGRHITSTNRKPAGFV